MYYEATRAILTGRALMSITLRRMQRVYFELVSTMETMNRTLLKTGSAITLRLGYVFVWIFVLMICTDTMGAQRLMSPGVPVPSAVRARLEAGLVALEREIEGLRQKAEPIALGLLPDVIIFHKAVDVALRYDEFIRTNEFEIADALLAQGMERAALLQRGEAPWTQSSGLVVRGYRSRIDDSVQPYGLVVPPSFSIGGGDSYRADVWLHGRDNRLTELKFLNQRMKSYGQFVPKATFVLHPYGRFCNAFKFGGEVDVFEALEAVRRHYPIDDRKIAVRGFSMGGAGCWHLAVHHPDVWVAAAPGAGFSESAGYLGLWKKEPKPTWYQQLLWHCYNATDYALNLFHNPTVAYSGGADKQIQAAEMMASALEKEGMRLRHIIGPDTGHSYHPDAKKEVIERVDAIVKIGKESVPRHVKFTTWTLRYARSHWIEIQGLDRHWQRAWVDAVIDQGNEIRVGLENISLVDLRFGPGESPLESGSRPNIIVNGSRLIGPRVLSDRSWHVQIGKENGAWEIQDETGSDGLKKRPGLQGPIDDVFMDRFIIVEPSGSFPSSVAGKWMASELLRLKREWRAQFRGVPITVKADQLTLEQIEHCHLIVWGDPSNNEAIRKMVRQLPVRWNNDRLEFGSESWDAKVVVPSLIYPNPLNPDRYVVINSGFTFRGFGSNATQVPMLPDFAFVDVREPATSLAPGKVLKAGFFDEEWGLNRER
jgi:hypothetical protein